MNWKLVIQIVATVILKLIASSVFLTYFPQISYKPVDPNVIAKDCPVSWESFKGKCYFFSSISQTWDESQKACAQFGSALAVVNSEEELVFLKSTLQFEMYFIGLTLRDGRWTWMDGTKFDPNIFDLNRGNFQCVVVGMNSINPASCSVGRGYICEKNA